MDAMAQWTWSECPPIAPVGAPFLMLGPGSQNSSALSGYCVLIQLARAWSAAKSTALPAMWLSYPEPISVYRVAEVTI